ncbi:hypothetical protein WDW37_00985 [Bdellovibrionota bacterium FG-1]
MQLARKRPVVPIHGPDDGLKTALCRVLFGIEETWGLDQNDLAGILHRRSSTISDWKTNQAVSVSPVNPSPNDTQIYEFIEFFDSVSSLFVRIEDQVGWLKTASPDFGGKSPLELLKLNNKNLFALREWVDHLARP